MAKEPVAVDVKGKRTSESKGSSGKKQKRRKKEESFEDSKKENEEINFSLSEITSLLRGVLTTVSSLEKLQAAHILPNLKMAGLLTTWNCTEVLHSWATKRPDIMPEPYRQKLDDCWSAALSRHQNTAVSLSGFERHRLNPTKLKEGVSRSHQNDGRGLEDLQYAKSFMTGKYIDEMTVYKRPMEDYDEFEDLIESLLSKGPVVVSYDVLPSYKSYDGKSVFIPTDMECLARLFEKFPGHSVLLTGCGIQLQNGEWVEFWETLDSRGEDWGRMGFGRLARRKGLFTRVTVLKVDGPPRV